MILLVEGFVLADSTSWSVDGLSEVAVVAWSLMSSRMDRYMSSNLSSVGSRFDGISRRSPGLGVMMDEIDRRKET